MNVIPDFTMPPTANAHEQARTPDRSPGKRAGGITHAQKQAMLDNLQLEITERARKLRAQYALQAQTLRSRLEMRVNRIPQALRKRKLQDLLDEHAEKDAPKPAPISIPISEPSTDKENIPSHHEDNDLPVAKKRATAPNTKPARTTSRAKAAPSAVLSPKSHNSRTLPRSPLKPSVRAPGPAKPSLAKRVPSRAQANRTEVDEGRTSEASNTSAGTTIVTKKGRPARKATAATKASTARKGVGRKEDVPPVPTGGGRSLRKRN